jgi:DNA-binding LacI/PurR family transcriptional regulator
LTTARAKAPTIVDVARTAGVSKSAVSRALLGQGEVSNEVRQRIQEAANQLGYVANAMARGLVSERTRTLGVVMHDVTDPFAGYLHVAMQRRALECGYAIVTATNTGDLTLDNAVTAVRTLVSLQVDGILISSARFPSDQVVPFTERLPVVAAGRKESDPALPSVCIDDEDGGRQLADHLLELGHVKVAVLLVDGDYSFSQHVRGAAMIERLESEGVEVVTIPVRSSTEANTVAPSTLSEAGVTAIMCPNDRTQITFMERCAAAGVRVPEDLSVTGFDGIGPVSTSLLGLTSFRQPIEEIGRIAVDFMLAALSDAPPVASHVVVKGTLIRGRTTAPPSGL